ncbi:phosphoglycerate mutase family domain-containing protein [Paracoccidioides lutzii Pb01]|uniref:Phosphoglycerate mutase family domain-containing protein n=1 Tax=Paracoccidioides lutzii (strain ATCC MYA-826 / Pb01) TaxID=502779 RepID=C1GTS2_PARBA|nr:phosphoglycerate mutase family domain-containing protein [Paracoccidioides lutzii Pb01]EEH39728.2 phosphoglycerate mutase family domain-containing protein [Paracoccidioides lutzii Pb01]
MIILIRHAQSEGNKNREIHQSIPDHRVKLTPEGQKQALEAGRRLRTLLRPDDTLHFFTSPYRRTRETTEGILTSLTSNDPSPSPFPRDSIKVYEEPRLREQDFGNFQPCSAEMERMWQERADYGHFFYRIPNGESAADAYDRVSGFNESLWRLFGEDDFASVCVLVTHGLMTRIFLMKWYHFSVEYFEDLRNVNHCEFVIMKKNEDDGKYTLQNNLRTWSELKLERERERERERASIAGVSIETDTTPGTEFIIPIRRKWGGCPNGCNHSSAKHWRRRPQRQYTKGILEGEATADKVKKETQTDTANAKSSSNVDRSVDKALEGRQDYSSPSLTSSSSPNATPSHISLDYISDSKSQQQSRSEDEQNTVQKPSSTSLQHRHDPHSRSLGGLPHQGGRDGGGSHSGAPSRATSDSDETGNLADDDENYKRAAPRRQSHGQHPHQRQKSKQRQGHGIANSLGDRDDEDDDHVAGKQGLLVDESNIENDHSMSKDSMNDTLGEEEDAVFEEVIKEDQSIRGSIY